MSNVFALKSILKPAKWVTVAFLASSLTIQAQQQPKLIVGVVVDQMKADYLYRYWDKLGENGFKRLIAQGYWCRNAHFNYVPTFTGPGHASVFTGTTPSVHGIIANNWYDRDAAAKVYCVSDPSVQSVGTKNNKGAMSPHRLLAPTLGDATRIATTFKGKSIGISLKDRSAILSSGQSANAAYWFDSETGNMITSSFYMSALPKWVSQFNSKKHPELLAKDGWNLLLAPHHYSASTADDTPYETVMVKGGRPVFPYDLPALMKSEGYDPFMTSPFGNSILTMFAEQCIINEDMGQDVFTDFLSISYSSPDLIGHAFGPQSMEVEDTYLRLDQEIALLIDLLNTRVGEGNYVLFLTADHAAAEVPQYLMDNRIPVGYMDDDSLVNHLKDALKEKLGTDEYLLHYSNQQVFLDHAKMMADQVPPQAVNAIIRTAAMEFEGVANVMNADEMQHSFHSDHFARLTAQGWHTIRSGDLFVQYLPGWMEWRHTGTTHGTSYTYDTHVPLIFFGAGIPVGESIDPVDITQIVPTICITSRIGFPACSDHRPIPFR